MIAVTSFSSSGYEAYGRKFLESAIKHWPTKIIVYHEGREPDIKHEKIEYRNLFDIGDMVQFLRYLQNIPLTRGKTPEGYNYNFDAWKFSRKSFCQMDVLKGYQGKVFWLDADIEFEQDVPEEFLNELFEGKGVVHFGREGFHTETGFVGFDTEHADFATFLEKYEQVYRRAIIFTLRRWHDCEALDWALSHCPDIARNLSPNYVHGTDSLDVMDGSILSPYLTHNKGARKYGATKIFKGLQGIASQGDVPRQVH